MSRTRLSAQIIDGLEWVPGFPKSGFNFPDITAVLERDPLLFRAIISEMLALTATWSFDTVLCIESFGYVFGVPIAYERSCKIALMRRPGKLPRSRLTQTYSMCYDSIRQMELHAGALSPRSRTLVVDDFLVSGGTISAALELIKRSGGQAAGVICVVEAPSWKGRDILAKHEVPLVSLAEITI